MAFKVEIVDINENADNILLTDDLTIELLKIRYNWILNAKVKNCIIGLDSYGIVWYSGEWICGEWEDGTWYSGIFHEGTWKNGKWYSYLLDKSMILSKRFVILEKNKIYSEFRSGDWMQGDFYDGIFGYDRDISGKLRSDIENKNFSTSIAYWHSGIFHNGDFKNSVWMDGILENGDMSNSYWLNGKFYKGTFNNHRWFDGLWYGGDFIQGSWDKGFFDQLDNNIKSRFGTGDKSIWYSGTFSSGQVEHQPEFHSGLNQDSSGITYPSVYQNKSTWVNGTFNGGKWYGGHFMNGSFMNGNWYGGVLGTYTGSTYSSNCVWNNGDWYNGLWINGTFKNGHFYNGIWMDGIFEYGYMSTNTVENTLSIIPPPAAIYPPTVETTTATLLDSTYSTVIGKGLVKNDGGGRIMDRGICWDTVSMPLTSGSCIGYATDGGTVGSMSIKMRNLDSETLYYYRSFAKNLTGITYGNVVSFTTKNANSFMPSVRTESIGSNDYTSFNATIKGVISYIPGSGNVEECGFELTGFTSSYVIVTATTHKITNMGLGLFSKVINTDPDTPYQYYAYAIKNGVYASGVTTGFTSSVYVPPGDPIVQTDTLDLYYGLSSTGSIILSGVTTGHIVNNSGGTITEVGAMWGKIPSPTSSQQMITSSPPNYFTINIDNLDMGTKYYVRSYAKNLDNESPQVSRTGYGNDLTGYTASLAMLSITTPTHIDYTYVNVSGSILQNGYGTGLTSSHISEIGFVYSTDVEPRINGSTTTKFVSNINQITPNTTNASAFNDTINGLIPHTTYHICSYAINPLGPSYSNDISFTTLGVDIKPEITVNLFNFTNNLPISDCEVGVSYTIQITGETILNDELPQYIGAANLTVNTNNSLVTLLNWNGAQTYSVNKDFVPISLNPYSLTFDTVATQLCGYNNYYSISGQSIASAYYPFLWTLTTDSKENQPTYFLANNLNDYFYKKASSGNFGGKLVEKLGTDTEVIKTFNMLVKLGSDNLSFGYPSEYNVGHCVYFSVDGGTNWHLISFGVGSPYNSSTCGPVDTTFTHNERIVESGEYTQNFVTNFDNSWSCSYTIISYKFTTSNQKIVKIKFVDKT